ncbi:uncharacterized protein BXZ73DRAFT_97172 [Epithele typhae]|uniref:uncharacterized protein n=1 Tax=Epithele typhae TaxID=378194 RepID=UPI0020076C4E|nr:uncharacterized protein BXZ73DRAFT_97172 [Epithele typhae]KAH9943117.1 hypothetical protein BXZ73DRAFT_97172 [Epithele typhae]
MLGKGSNERGERAGAPGKAAGDEKPCTPLLDPAPRVSASATPPGPEAAPTPVPDPDATAPADQSKHRTARVARPFKSPLPNPDDPSGPAPMGPPSTSLATPSSSSASSAAAAATIRALQSQAQTLRQAVRIKLAPPADSDPELARLAGKWTVAGREVAWALWERVRDMDPGSAAGAGGFGDEVGRKRGMWEEEAGPAKKRARMDGEGQMLGEDEDEGLEDEVVQHTLGVMLRRLGIDPVTLGWDEEEGDFVQVDV